MPTYDIKCDSCGHVWEAFQAMSAPATGTTCPRCGGAETHRRPSAPAVRFVGPGFYETDYGFKKWTGDPKKPSWRDDVKWNDDDSVA